MSSQAPGFIDFKHFDTKRTVEEVTAFIGLGWALWSEPYKVATSMAVGAAFAHLLKGAPPPIRDTVVDKYQKRVIAHDGGYEDEVVALSVTGVFTGIFKSTFGAIATGLNAGQLAYRDISRLLYGRNKLNTE